MNLLIFIIFLLFPISNSIRPENEGFNNKIIFENKRILVIEIAGKINKLEEGLKRNSLNNTLNSINNKVSEELTKGLLGYVSKHTLANFKDPTNMGENVSELRNSSDLEIDSKNNTEHKGADEVQINGLNSKLDNISNSIAITRFQT
ncbi:uncharacterized protein cubi_01839 [Cryptosporidium ubiquitum]|uniref:Secreted ookinete protein n=1 Tax=Cryptosporidium ubiquitum TaxID=857276 RepID=A0A1J4MMB1_9CRYT|nr:uncharacterized protein cubi_01839 [Cryptosporidium ubiquitum]OII75318.1 hypothetical protein cubi_01839 [Cryptosporidium ubiquitum]